MSAARRLFTERGYADVPADEIVAAAGVTRGAMYHHFTDKRDLFRAVYEDVESEVTAALGELLVGVDPADLVDKGLTAYLDMCERPDVLRIAIVEAPAVLGWQEWRELEARYGLGLVTALLLAQGIGEDRAPTLAKLVLGALVEAALVIAHAPKPKPARRDVEAGLRSMLSGVLAGYVNS